MDNAARGNSSTLNLVMLKVATFCAYAGGVIVSAIGIMSVISIVGRSTVGKPVIGDFELVEIGTAVAGSLFLPYCQASGGHIVVDFFTLRAGALTPMYPGRASAQARAMIRGPGAITTDRRCGPVSRLPLSL